MSYITAELAAESPDELGLCDDLRSYSRRALEPVLNRVSNAMRDLRLTPGCRIAVFARNSADNVLAYQGALHAGISSVPVSAHLTVDEVAYILEDSSTEVLFVGPDTTAVGIEAAHRAGISRIIGWRCAGAQGVKDWEGWLNAASAAPPPDNVTPAPMLHYTSGTTGRPKGTETPPTMFPREKTVRAYFDALRARQGGLAFPSPALIVSPMHHTGPLISARLLGAGLSLVVLPRFDAEEVLATIERHRVRSVMMVPTHFQRLLALPREVRDKYEVSSLEQVSHTGAACPREVKRQMIEWFGPVLLEAYGATESGSTNMITSEEWLRKPGSVGRTLPPFEVEVISDTGEKLPCKEVGVLYFRDTSGRGIVYHNDSEKTAGVHREPGVFTLGEMGYVDEDGYVFITDRISDMIVSGGVNIYPVEIEDVLCQAPGVRDVAVIGIPNAEMGEEVKALIVPEDLAAPPSMDALNRFCRERIAAYKAPRTYGFVADIGRNPMGKINKKVLRKPYWPTERTIGG